MVRYVFAVSQSELSEMPSCHNFPCKSQFVHAVNTISIHVTFYAQSMHSCVFNMCNQHQLYIHLGHHSNLHEYVSPTYLWTHHDTQNITMRPLVPLPAMACSLSSSTVLMLHESFQAPNFLDPYYRHPTFIHGDVKCHEAFDLLRGNALTMRKKCACLKSFL